MRLAAIVEKDSHLVKLSMEINRKKYQLPVSELLSQATGATKKIKVELDITDFNDCYSNFSLKEIPVTLVRIPDGLVAIIEKKPYTAEAMCDRCLKKTTVKHSLKSSELQYYLPQTDEEDLPDDFEFIDMKHHLIDLTSLFNETINLSMPDRILCAKSCTGIEFNKPKKTEAGSETNPFASLKDMWKS